MDRRLEQRYALLPSDQDDISFQVAKKPQNQRSETRSVGIASLTLCGLLALLTFLAVNAEPDDMQCTKQLNLWSPMLEAVEYYETDFGNEFNSTSIYRGLPVPEREEAWMKLVTKHAIEVPVDKIHGLNRTEADMMKHVPTEVGTGYIGFVEVFHQLHCLNLIRVYTWLQLGKYPNPPPMLAMSEVQNRMHVDHCIESLRLVFQCWSDVTPVLIKLGGPVGRKADFNTHHKCRNFEKIENWIDTKWTVP